MRLLSVKDSQARRFYEAHALRGGWSVRQLDRQIESQFYERTALSRNKDMVLAKAALPMPGDAVTPDDAIKDPYVLEFLDLKDEYSESELEAALTQHLEGFLLELGEGFTFVGRQRRLRIDQTWYRVDLLLFHRKLRSLVIIDLKLGSLSHSDVGQMHMYCNYAKAHWALADENPPVGLILCADKGRALAQYALEGLPTQVMAANYRTDVYKRQAWRWRGRGSNRCALARWCRPTATNAWRSGPVSYTHLADRSGDCACRHRLSECHIECRQCA